MVNLPQSELQSAVVSLPNQNSSTVVVSLPQPGQQYSSGESASARTTDEQW